jgi:outer membrane protein assembly factor BamB
MIYRQTMISLNLVIHQLNEQKGILKNEKMVDSYRCYFFLLTPNLYIVKAERITFLDVPSTHWASEEIQWISSLNKSPVIGSDGMLYIQEGYFFVPSSQEGIFAISFNGELKGSLSNWQWSHFPVIGKNGIVYAVGCNGVFAFYPDGTLKWKYDGIESTETSPIIVGNDGLLYAAGTEVHVLNKEGNLRWRRFWKDPYRYGC